MLLDWVSYEQHLAYHKGQSEQEKYNQELMRTRTNKEQTAWSVVEARENTGDPVWIEILKDSPSIPDQSQNKVEQNPYKPGVLSILDWNVL